MTVLVLMGVSGCGKTTIGLELAKAWAGSVFLDADDFHPPANVAKMRAGQPLNDADRLPWLTALAVSIEKHQAADANLILACSALKFKYREILRSRSSPENVHFVLLNVSYELVSARLASRKGHFFNPVLLKSQFEDLELAQPEEHIILVDASKPPPAVALAILHAAGLVKSNI